MKTSFRFWLTSILLFCVASAALAVPFTPGNLAVVHFGDGTAALGSAGTPMFIDEFTTAGTFVQSIPIPTAVGAPLLVVSGTATSEGALMRSPNGQFLSFAGYGAPVGTAAIAGTASATVPRVVGIMTPAGVPNIAANTPVQFSASNIRSGVFDGANNFWAGGGNSGTFYFGFTAASVTVQNAVLNTRVYNIQNGNLMFSTGSGTRGIYTFAGMPTAASVPALLFATGANSSPYAFAINPAGTVVYVADDTAGAAGGVQRWNNVAGTWTLVYTLSSGAVNIGARGLVVDWSGAAPVIYSTTGEGVTVANRLIKIVDTGGASVPVTLTPVLPNRAFRGVAFTPQLPPIVLTCSPDITVTATSAAGAVVTYPLATTSGGCAPLNVSCNPPSGSTFPIGTTTVTCSASDSCGQTANCSFKVTVNPPPVQEAEIFFPIPVLPPTNGMYVPPPTTYITYTLPSGVTILVRNPVHRSFSVSLPPPVLGQTQLDTFNSELDFEVSMNNGATWQLANANAMVTVNVTHSLDAGGTSYFDTEMTQLDISGGSLPVGMMIRESPTLASTGQTTIRNVAGGYLISSFFDVFTEISMDGGATWSPAQSAVGGPQAHHVRLRKDPHGTPLVPEPTPLLPPPNDQYVSPEKWHALFAQGIVIKDVAHKFFTDSQPPPATGGTNVHNFNSTLDLQLSLDGGNTYQFVRVPNVAVQVSVTGAGGDGGASMFDTEMTSLSFSVPGTPVMIRESPTLPSRGMTEIRDPQADGSYRVGSFFDIWPELSLDGGANWSPATNGPVRMELVEVAPQVTKPTSDLPPLDGGYISPEKWHALYANGIIITNASHDRFTQTQPPPPPGGSAVENFGSRISGRISMDGGVSFQPFSVNANVTIGLNSHASLDSFNTRFFDAQMLGLSVSGGTIRLRESPTLASLGRTSVRQDPDPASGLFYIDSFFDVFTEISLDGGNTWSSQTNAPGTVGLTPPPPPIVLTCSTNITITASGPGGAVVYFSSSATGGCAPVVVNCLPPSGSTFPVGTNTVTCTATDACGQTANCSFTVIVKPLSNDPCHEPDNGSGTVTLPPPGCEYLSPDEVHLIINGLPAGTTIEFSAIHRDFICKQGGGAVCSNDCFSTDVDCNPANGATEAFGSSLQLHLHGTGSLLGWDRDLTIPNVYCQSQVGPRVPGSPVQSFDTEMLSIQGQLPPGDPDFAQLQVVAGSAFGLPSPGHTTLTQLPGGNWAVDSFFDINYRIDFVGAPGGHVGGFAGATMSMIRMVAVRPPPAPIVVTCSSNLTVTATSAAGAVVLYTSSATGGCPLVNVSCNPPSGSLFPIGTTTVTCTATDACGQSATCGFTVTVNPPQPQVPEYFSKTNALPPPKSVYITPELWHVLYANGIIIRDVRHRFFTHNLPPPAPGQTQTHTFDSQVDFEVSQDNGATFQPATGTAQVAVRVTHAFDAGGRSFFDTEMLQLDLTGAGVPPGMRLRESPTLASTGKTTIRPVAGGYMISSFFDVFTDLSMDGGATWLPAVQSAHVELRNDPATVAAVDHPTALLPPPNGGYVSPAMWDVAFASGIVIRDVSQKFFTDSQPAPPVGGSNTQTFNSQVDLQVSTDGGNTFQYMRAPTAMSVRVTSQGSAASGFFDTEMLALNLTLPNGLMIRESPTEPSRGQTTLQAQSGGNYRIHSFFDVFTELSLDGGQTWAPASNGPVRVELTPVTPEVPEATPDLPPLDGAYVSPEKWHALYANGIVISNASHDRFTQNQPPPPPNGQQTENFGSHISGQISQDGGASFSPFSASAQVVVKVASHLDSGATRFFDTEMLSLGLQGGSLPPNIMVRESPSKASLGKTSIRTVPGGYKIDSFFDIFTEISLDGGANWSPQVTAPGTMGLRPPPPSLTLNCSSNITLTASGPAGAVVTFPLATASGGCPPVSVNCVPPSGSLFPIGVTTVTCTATDACGQTVTCSFTITVKPPVGDPCLEPDNGSGTVTLPPPGCQYLSPDQVHMIIDGLPPGTTIELAAIHKDFICHEGQHPCTNDCYATGVCNPALGGTEAFNSTLQLHLHGTGALAGWDRDLTIPNLFCESQVGPRVPGTPVQSFATDMTSIQGQITGDPDFDLLRITAGSTFGLPSPGHTTLTLQPGGNWAVDSFFDITYRIDFVGRPGGALAGKSGSTTGTIRMVAARPPTPQLILTCSTNIAVTATSGTGAVVTFSSSTTGGCTPVTLGCNPPSGSTFPIGTTTVTCTASDACGVTNTCNFTVTVNPLPAIKLTCSTNITVTAAGSTGAVVTYSSSASGGCPPVNVVCNPPSGSTFPVGTTPVTCVASDACGQQTTCGFTVTVVLPAISLTCSSNLTVTTTTATGATVNYTSSISGGCSPATVNCTPPSGSVFPIGTTTVTCAGTDACGQQTNCSFTVTVRRLTLTIQTGANGLQVIWSTGTLQQADKPEGPYIDIDPQPTSPWTVTPSGAKRFFRVRSGQPGFTFYDTEMLQLDISGGNLPTGMMIRESPTLASTGKTAISPMPGGGFMIDSFFDVFTELTTDGGQTWQASTSAPPRMRFTGNSPTDTLPPKEANYVSPAQWHALYAQGIYITNASHLGFLGGSFPPPPPGGNTDTHSFGSTVQMTVNPCPGCPPQTVSAPAQVTVKVRSRP